MIIDNRVRNYTLVLGWVVTNGFEKTLVPIGKTSRVNGKVNLVMQENRTLVFEVSSGKRRIAHTA